MGRLVQPPGVVTALQTLLSPPPPPALQPLLGVPRDLPRPAPSLDRLELIQGPGLPPCRACLAALAVVAVSLA